MLDRFGPWSTALGDGASPNLSTLWRRRMSLLESVRTARHATTRRDWLQMSLAAASALALPTLHLAFADDAGVVKTSGKGRIYVRGNFDTGDGKDEALSGFFAIDAGSLTKTKVLDDSPARCRVSPNGRTLAVSRSGWWGPDHQLHNEDVGTWAIDTHGKAEKRKIADFGGVTCWSPDGKQIIVSKGLSKPDDDDMRHEAWRFNVDGTGITKLPIPVTDEVDDWSLDGLWLVTVSDRHPPHGRGYQLYIMRPDGTGQRRLTEGQGLNVYPRFSPDSRQIAYLHQERGKNSLWIVNIDGSGRRLVVEEQGNESVGALSWAPDGKSLIYKVENWERDDKGQAHSISDFKKADPRLAVINSDGTNNRRLNLPLARWIESPDWR